jgi:hypothetical protein
MIAQQQSEIAQQQSEIAQQQSEMAQMKRLLTTDDDGSSVVSAVSEQFEEGFKKIEDNCRACVPKINAQQREFVPSEPPSQEDFLNQCWTFSEFYRRQHLKQLSSHAENDSRVFSLTILLPALIRRSKTAVGEASYNRYVRLLANSNTRSNIVDFLCKPVLVVEVKRELCKNAAHFPHLDHVRQWIEELTAVAAQDKCNRVFGMLADENSCYFSALDRRSDEWNWTLDPRRFDLSNKVDFLKACNVVDWMISLEDSSTFELSDLSRALGSTMPSDGLQPSTHVESVLPPQSPLGEDASGESNGAPAGSSTEATAPAVEELLESWAMFQRHGPWVPPTFDNLASVG